ncbi:hypothetical protein [Psychrobacillus sp. MER TA 171]|uniref:hypothetical protein n=1 Tax=Psychrobacillus sp. MER TA 171 TaxID=2939577 RepID=UPI00203B91DF|nr:hypothetical protein [Psychrobacillus sp. MER TA 171]MCM3359219.1 hypothetical protein [Psychrobacillus sp. MER TA 171]
MMMRKYAFYLVFVCFVAFYIHQPLFGLIPNAVAGYIQDKKEEERIAEFLKDYQKVDVAHVTIHYVDADEGLLPTAKLALEEGIERNEQVLGPLDKSVDLIIFPNREDRFELFGLSHFFQNNGIPEYDSIAIFPEDRRAIFSEMEPSDLLYKNVIHDYTQYRLVQRLSELRLDSTYIPTWFFVGLGEYMSYDGEVSPRLEVEAVPLSSLSAKIAGIGDEENTKRNGYLQAHLTIRYVVEEYGTGIIDNILRDAEKEKNFGKAFLHHTGIGLTSVPEIY